MIDRVQSPALRRFLRNRAAVVGLLGLLLLMSTALLGPLLVQADPDGLVLGDELLPPSAEHWLGTDPDGVDVLSRLLSGARLSLFVAFSTVLVCLGIGTCLGALAGLRGGLWDRAIFGLTELLQGFPGLLIPLSIAAFFPERGLGMVVVALSVGGWVGYCRVVRARIRELRTADFVLAARAAGIPSTRLFWKYLLPNVLPALVVQGAFGMAGAILAEAGLSYLGLGLPPGAPSWGAMLNAARSTLLVAPHLALWPGAALLSLVLSVNLVADGLRDALDPRG